MTTFAARTRVPVEKTRTEKIVKRYGAKGFIAGWQGDTARIEFLCSDRHIRISVPTPSNSKAADEQITRQKWRALLLVIKAKLEAVDAKIATFEQAFATDIVLPNGKTVWEEIREPIALAYRGKDVTLLERPR